MRKLSLSILLLAAVPVFGQLESHTLTHFGHALHQSATRSGSIRLVGYFEYRPRAWIRLSRRCQAWASPTPTSLA